MTVVISVLEERCKGCRICIEICQTQVLKSSDKKNSLGFFPPVAVNPESCLECGLCEMLCPDFAIWVTVTREEAEA